MFAVISRRDWFAGQALAGLSANQVVIDGGNITNQAKWAANAARELADATLAAIEDSNAGSPGEDPILEALLYAREKMWEYGFKEDDIRPIRLAIDLIEARTGATSTLDIIAIHDQTMAALKAEGG